MKSRSTVKFTTKMTRLGCAVGALALLATVGVAGTSSAATTHSSKLQPHAVLVSHVVKPKKIAFRGSYSGSMTFLLTSVASTSTAASVTSVSGKGTSTTIGTTTLTGTGNVPATAASSGFHFTGSGKLAGAGGTLTLRILSRHGHRHKWYGKAEGRYGHVEVQWCLRYFQRWSQRLADPVVHEQIERHARHQVVVPPSQLREKSIK